MTKLDYRELLESDEEALLSLVDYIRSLSITTHPVKVAEDTEQGQHVKLQPMVKKSRETEEGKIETFDMTTLDQVPIRYQRGGGVVQTHPVKKDDIGYWVPFARDVQGVRKNDGVQDPATTRINSFSDGYFTSGFRPDPQHKTVMGKDGKRFSKDTHQLRSDDGRHTADLHPGDPKGEDKKGEKKKKGGFINKSVHPDDKTDKDGNPFADAKKYAEHRHLGNDGIKTTLVKDKDKKHWHEIETNYEGHKVGTGNDQGERNHFLDLHEDDEKAYKLSIAKETHYHSVTKEGGHKISADKDKHYLELKPGNSATLKSETKVTLDCEQGTCESKTPTHHFTGDANVDKDVNCKNCNAQEKVQAQNILGQTGNFGALGGMSGGGGGAGGTMGSNGMGDNAGASSGVGAGGMAAGAAANNVGELGGALTGTLPDPELADAAVDLHNLKNSFAYHEDSSNTAHTATAANISGGIIEVTLALTGTLGAARNLQLPTVADLVATIGDVVANCSYKLVIYNNSSANYAWTVTTNTGWSLNGTMSIAQNTKRIFYITFSSTSAATIQSVGT